MKSLRVDPPPLCTQADIISNPIQINITHAVPDEMAHYLNAIKFISTSFQ